MNFNIFNKVKKGATWLFGFQDAHAFLTPDQVEWSIENKPEEWEQRNKAKTLLK